MRARGAAPCAAGVDPFRFGEEKLEDCRALESSLWEVDCLRQALCSDCVPLCGFPGGRPYAAPEDGRR